MHATQYHELRGREDRTSKKAFCSGVMWFSGMYMSLVSWQTTMACRWLKVPRPTSCPLMRMLNP